jgi:hypothetical protein
MKITMKISIRIFIVLALLSVSILVTPSASAWNDGASIAVSAFSGEGNEEPLSIAVDSNGNIYSTGIFTGTVDFDPGDGISNLTSAGESDIFISKLDAYGNYLWAKRFGSATGDTGKSIAIDSSGNISVTGDFTGSVDFDPGIREAVRTSLGSYDFFVLKLDSSGNYLWVNSVGGLQDESGIFLAVDNDGSSLVTGIFGGTVDFDPGAGTLSLTSDGSLDIFVSKFDSAGNHLWSKRRGGNGLDIGDGIAVDGSGNVYTSGIFAGTVDFDPSDGVANLTSAGSNDMFISKFDASGNYLWAKRFGGSGSDGNTPIAIDGNGNIYASGEFSGTVDFYPGDGVFNLTAVGSKDNFISKLDDSGNLIWAKRIGSLNASTTGARTSIDKNGNIYFTGDFSGTVDLDPGDGTANLTSALSNDIFISKLDSGGNFRWAKRIGGSGADRGQAIAVDINGNVYSAGYFSGTVDFDPGDGTANVRSAGGKDIFISKLDSSGNAPQVAAVSAGSAPNSKVATIPSGVTEATIASSNQLPAIKLNFGGTVPTAVTVAPVAANSALLSVAPFTLGSSKIVDITLSSAHDGSAVTICLDGGSADRLYHYKNSAWVELGSRSYANGQVCGVTTSFSPFVAAPAAAPVYVAPTPVPYLKTLTTPKLNLKEGKLVCTPGTYNSGYTLDGVIQGSPTAIFSPSIYTYDLLINGVAQTSKVLTSASTSTSWEMQAIPSGSLVACSVTVNANSLTNTDKSSDNTAAVSSALTTQSQAIKAAEAAYSETVSTNSKTYQKALVDNRATWRKEIEMIQSDYIEALNRIKAKGGPNASSEKSAALKLRINAAKKSAADYAASKPAALAAKDAANKVALDVKSDAIAKANLFYGTFIESIGYGVLIP